MSLPRRIRRTPSGGSGEKLRRDPRAEYSQPAEETTPPPGPRTRRDPRAERGPGAPAGETPRVDRARPLRPVEDTTSPERPVADTGPKPVVIDNPAYWVVAVPDLESGRLSPHDRSLLGAARRLADAGGGAVVVVAFTPADDLGAAGADRVMQFQDTGPGAPEGRAEAVRSAVESLEARYVVFPETVNSGSDLGRRVAAGLGEMPATRVQAISNDRILSRGDGEAVEYEREPPRVMLMAPDVVDAVSETVHEARPLPTAEVGLVESGIIDVAELPLDPAGVPLAEAEFILAAGNGVKDWPTFHALAAALGASEGGSRPVCDAGDLPRDRQIGASGTLVSARCYLALGISGAPQHLQGITDCEYVVAVNIDAHAEMLKRADLGVVSDVQALMSALLTLLTTGDGDDA